MSNINRVPLIANTTANRIEELPTGDNLDLSNSGIYANGNLGNPGYVLTSDGTKVTWAPTGNVVASGIQQLTNKVLDASNNTIINIPNSSLLNSSININGNQISLGTSVSGLSTATSTEFLQNKTIDANYNTLSNIPNSALVNNSISINGTPIVLGSGIVIQQLYANVVASGVQTLTNKTMDGGQNTFTNIPNSALVKSYIKINNVDIPLGGGINVGDLTSDGPGTITNKTINGNDNTLLNVSVDSLTSKSIVLDGQTYSLGGVYNLNLTTNSNTQELTNKTISGSGNTFSNIPNSALVNDRVYINGEPVQLGQSINVGTITSSGNATLTQKTIDGSLNTITNISNNSLSSAGQIVLDGQFVKLGDTYVSNRRKTNGTFTTNLGASPVIDADDTLNNGYQVLIGKTNTSITSWNFNMPYGLATSGWTGVYEILVNGNPSYTYGSACTVNGNSAGNIKWAGGSAPTAVSGYTYFKFRVIRDTSGSAIVLGSAVNHS